MTLFRRGRIWYLDVVIDGKRHRESLQTADRTLAKLKARARIRELQGTKDFRRITLTEFISEYLTYSISIKSHSTVITERSALRRLQTYLTCTYLDQITPHMIDSFISAIAADGVTAAGINYYIRTLRSIFNVALRWEYITNNPLSSTKFLLVQSEPPRVLSSAELSTLFAIIGRRYPRYVDVFRFMLYTGLRRSEVVNLRWDDVDLNCNHLIIRGKRRRLRYVPLLPQARDILLRRQAQRLQQPFPVSGYHLSHVYLRCARIAGINNTSLHDLRRTFASTLLAHGVNREIVQKILGHSNFATTDTYYFGLSADLINSMTQLEINHDTRRN